MPPRWAVTPRLGVATALILLLSLRNGCAFRCVPGATRSAALARVGMRPMMALPLDQALIDAQQALLQADEALSQADPSSLAELQAKLEAIQTIRTKMAAVQDLRTKMEAVQAQLARDRLEFGELQQQLQEASSQLQAVGSGGPPAATDTASAAATPNLVPPGAAEAAPHVPDALQAMPEQAAAAAAQAAQAPRVRRITFTKPPPAPTPLK